MNYGYDETSPNWDEEKKEFLARELSKKLPAKEHWTPGGMTPYIEIDGLYSGVRIRKITNISKEDHEQFIKRADKIYEEVMKK